MKVKLLFGFLLFNMFLLASAATPPSATISYNSPVCTGSGLTPVIFSGTTGGTFSASPANLSINPITGTITPSTSLPGVYTITYFIPSGVDPAFTTSTTFIIVDEPNSGIDGAISICQDNGTTIDLFSVISDEQSGGTWTRFSGSGGTFNAVNGTFTPDFGTTTSQFMYTVSSGGPCMAMPSMATININNMVYPSFAQMSNLCPGATPPILPTFSPNGISGTWSPSTISTQTVGTDVYVFTPNAGQCATILSLAITVAEAIEPIFTFSSSMVCLGNAPVLPTTSANGITGTWSPSAVTTTGIYMFTPNVGQCATNTTTTFQVNPAPTAMFSVQNMTVCAGSTATISIIGTPNSTVTYMIDSGFPQTIALSNTGTTTLTTPTLTTSTMICLVSVASGGGVNCTTSLTGCCIITVVPNAIITPMPNVTVCDYYTLPPLQIGNYYTAPNGGGSMLHVGDIITNTQLIYVYWSGVCGSDEDSFVVTVNHAIPITPMPDVTACGAYNLPVNNEATYYPLPNGQGMPISPNNIYSSQTIYLYATTATTPTCVSESSFQVTIIPAVTPVITTENNSHHMYVDGTTVVQPLLLNAEVAGNYSYQWMELHVDIPGATSPTYLLDYHIAGFNHFISVRITNNDTNCVTTSALFEVGEIPVPAPVGDPNQTFTLGQTLADVIISGQNIQWYDVFNRNATSNPLPLSTPLVEGVTYYATQTISGYESASAFEITIQFLANDTFGFKDLKFSPNPVRDVLHITSKDRIKDVTVFNIMGQKILQQHFESLDLSLSLSQLKAGNYFIKLESDNKSQVIKVIKE